MAQTSIRPEQIRIGPMSVYRNVNLREAGEVIKNAPGKVLGWDIGTTAAAERYVKLYDKDTPPTASDPVKITIVISNSAPARISFTRDLKFDVGIGIRATTGSADTDTGVPLANSIFVNIFYE